MLVDSINVRFDRESNAVLERNALDLALPKRVRGRVQGGVEATGRRSL